MDVRFTLKSPFCKACYWMLLDHTLIQNTILQIPFCASRGSLNVNGSGILCIQYQIPQSIVIAIRCQHETRLQIAMIYL